MKYPPFAPVTGKERRRTAEELAAIIRAAWRKCGYDVEVWPDGIAVRSELVRGLPRCDT